MPLVLDSHAWVWWATEDRRLSKPSARAIARAAADAGVAISAISVWEIAKKVEKQQVVLDRPLRDWIERALALRGLTVAEITPAILIESCSLPQPFHGDPADQIIVATARHLRATLVTKDRRLRDYAHVSSLW